MNEFGMYPSNNDTARRWMAERGGSGYLDRYGRVNAQGENAPRAAWPAWMNLVAAGLLAGGDQRLTITDYGKRHLPPKVEWSGSSLLLSARTNGYTAHTRNRNEPD